MDVRGCGGNNRILLLRLTDTMKQNNCEHSRSDSRQLAKNSLAHQETILCGCFLISQAVIGNAFGNACPDSVTPSNPRRGFLVPIPHNYIVAVMIYPTSRPFLFIIENLFSG